MRHSLAPFLGSFVHCSGWISDWELFKKTNIRRICVSNVSVKKADKTLTFDKQEVIDKLGHLNIFCDLTKHPLDDSEKYQRISFSGHVIQYTRKNGSIDYGIKLARQLSFYKALNLVEENLQILCAYAGNKIENYFSLIHTLEFLLSLESAIDLTGNHLTTFEYNYNEYKMRICKLIAGIQSAIQQIRLICGNRRMRRRCKVSRELAEQILRCPALTLFQEFKSYA
jgi:hypothetical protein